MKVVVSAADKVTKKKKEETKAPENVFTKAISTVSKLAEERAAAAKNNTKKPAATQTKTTTSPVKTTSTGGNAKPANAVTKAAVNAAAGKTVNTGAKTTTASKTSTTQGIGTGTKTLSNVLKNAGTTIKEGMKGQTKVTTAQTEKKPIKDAWTDFLSNYAGVVNTAKNDVKTQGKVGTAQADQKKTIYNPWDFKSGTLPQNMTYGMLKNRGQGAGFGDTSFTRDQEKRKALDPATNLQQAAFTMAHRNEGLWDDDESAPLYKKSDAWLQKSIADVDAGIADINKRLAGSYYGNLPIPADAEMDEISAQEGDTLENSVRNKIDNFMKAVRETGSIITTDRFGNMNRRPHDPNNTDPRETEEIAEDMYRYFFGDTAFQRELRENRGTLSETSRNSMLEILNGSVDKETADTLKFQREALQEQRKNLTQVSTMYANYDQLMEGEKAWAAEHQGQGANQTAMQNRPKNSGFLTGLKTTMGWGSTEEKAWQIYDMFDENSVINQAIVQQGANDKEAMESMTKAMDHAFFYLPEEVDFFKAHMEAGDIEGAMAFHEGLKTTLNQRYRDWDADRWVHESDVNPIGTGIGSLISQKTSGISMAAGAVAKLFGDNAIDDPNSWVHSDTDMTGVIRSNITGNVGEAVTKLTGNENIGKLAQLATGGVLSGADSGLDYLIGKGLANLLQGAGLISAAKWKDTAKAGSLGVMFTEVWKQSYHNTLKESDDPTYSAITATIDGGLEILFETILGADIAFREGMEPWKYVAGTYLGELIEEEGGNLAAPVVNTIKDNIYEWATTGNYSGLTEWDRKAIAKYNSDPEKYKGNEGRKQAYKETMEEFGKELIDTAISTAFSTVPKAAATGGQIYSGYRETGRNISINQETLQELADLASNDADGETARRGQSLANKIAAGKKASNAEIGSLFTTLVNNNNARIQQVAGQILDLNVDQFITETYGENGLSQEERQAAIEAIHKAVQNGQEALNGKDRKTLAQHSALQDLVNDFVKVQENKRIDENKRSKIVMKNVRAQTEAELEARGLKGKAQKLGSMAETDLQRMYRSIMETERRTGEKARVAVETAANKMASAEQIQAAGIRTEAVGEAARPGNTENRNRLIFDTTDENGEQLTGAGAILRKEGENYIVQTDAGEMKINAADAKAADKVTAAVMQFAEVTEADDQFATTLLKIAQSANVTEQNVEEMLNGARDMLIRGHMGYSLPESIKMDIDTAEALYREGVQQAKDYEADRKARAAGNGSILKPGEGKTEYRNVNMDELTAEQRRQTQAIEAIAKKVGFNVIFENDRNARGRYGEYDHANNAVIINLAGQDRSGMDHHVMVTASHELTHLLENNSPEAYAELKKFVFEEMNRNGGDIISRIAQKQDNYNIQIRNMQREGSNAELIDIEGAMAEIVADGCDQVLGDERLIRQIAEDHPNLYTKIKNFVADFAEKIRSAAAGMRQSGSIDSLYIRNVDELARKWGIALQEVENNENMESSNEREKNETSYSLKDKYGNTDQFTKDRIDENKKTVSNMDPIQDYFRTNYQISLSEEEARQARELMEIAREIPAGYFEAKPERVVGFDEINKIILPEGETELIDQLDKAGIPYETYDGTEDDRLAKLNGKSTATFSLAEAGPDASDWIMGLDPNDLTSDSMEFLNTKGTRAMIREYQKLVRGIQETREKMDQMREARETAQGDELRKIRINLETEQNKLNRMQQRINEISSGQDFGRLMQRAQTTIDTFLRGKTQEEVNKSIKKMKTEAKQMRETAEQAAKDLEKLAAREDAVIAHRFFDGAKLSSAAKAIQEKFNGRGDAGIIEDRIGSIGLKIIAGDGEGMQNEIQELVDYMINADWATFRFGMFGGKRFEAQDVQGEIRNDMVGTVMDQVFRVIPDMNTNPAMKTEAESLIRYIHSLTSNTRQAARGMARMAELAQGMQEQGDRLGRAAETMRGDLNRAIRYFDEVNAKNKAEVTAEQIEQITRTLESKAAQRVLDEQNKWAKRIETDRNLRRLTTENLNMRRKINTAYNRVAKLILDETDQTNIPEYMKPVARAALRMITANDVSGGKKITGVDLMTLQRSRQTLELIDQRDGTAIDFNEIAEILGDSDVSDTIEDALEKIERGIGFYSGGGRGRTGSTLEGDKAALTQIQDGMTTIYNVVSRSRDIWIGDKNVETANAAYEVETEAKKRDAYREWTGGLGRVIRGAQRTIVLGNLTPEYFFKNLKNNGLSRIYQEFKRGEDRYGRILLRARNQIRQIAEETGYGNWDTEEKHTIALTSGENVNLTLEQMMSLYATWKREKTLGPEMSDHLGKGGFVFEEKTESKLLGREAKTQKPHRVTAADITKIENALTSEQKQYVDRMVGIMSNEMAQIGNEASMRMFGIEKYKETYYFPFAVWDGVKNKSSDAGATVNPTNNNRAAHQSFTKRRKAGANNAVMLRDFSQVVAEHVNQMATYATMGQAIEGMNRVLNFRVLENMNDPNTATERNVESILTERYGQEAMKYIRQFMQDLNGGAVQQGAGLGQRLMSMFKKNAVGGSLSVAAQQPLSYIRASTMISVKHLTEALNPAYYRGSYNEMLEHSGVAVIKDMGKFDMNFSQGAAKWLHPDTMKHGIRRVYSRVEEATNALPEKMDQMTWTRMWSAIKCEQHELHPEMDMKSDEFLDMVGERFNDVMRKTQVYDSVLVKSQLMRSPGWFEKSITAFRAEPTLSLNLMIDALQNIRERGGRKKFAAVMATYLLSAIAQAAVKGIMGAGRNPDEKKTLAENFAYRFGSSFISEVNPLGLIPGYDNIIDLLSGNDVNDNAWGMIKTLGTTMQKVWNPPTGEELTAESGYRYLEDTAGQIAQMFTGISAKNLMRDSRAIYNWFMAPYADRARTETDKKTGETRIVPGRANSGAVMRYQLIDQVTSTDLIGAINGQMNSAIWDKSQSGYYERIYQAEKNGNAAEAEGMREYLSMGKGTAEKTISSGIASLAKKDESLTTAERADWLLDRGYVNDTSWITGEYKKGNISDSELQELYKEHFPDKNVDSTMWNYYRDQYKEGEISEAEAKKAYLKYNPKKNEGDWLEYLWGDIREDYTAGKISEAEATAQYRKYHPDKTEQQIRDYFWKDKWNDYKDGKISEAEARKLYRKYHPEATEKDAGKVFWGLIQDEYKDGKISRAEAEKAYRKNYPDAKADDVWWTFDKLDYQKETGKNVSGDYYRMNDAISENRSQAIATAVQTVMKHGKTKTGVKGSIESNWKEKYLAMRDGSQEKVKLKDGIQKAMKSAGYTEAETQKMFKKWTEKK